MPADPLRMYLVLRRGAIAELARAGELAGAAAVACVRAFADAALWRELVQRGMRSDFSWRRSARAYLEVFQAATSEAERAGPRRARGPTLPKR